MIKKNILYLFIFFSLSTYSQAYKSLIEKDTICFYFDYSNNLEKTMSYVDDFTSKDSSFVYTYTDSYDYGNLIKSIKLKKGKNLSTNNTLSNYKSDVKIITKQDFQNNKLTILKPQELKKGLLKRILDLEIKLDNKVIYVIDEKEKWGKDYIAKEVYLTMEYKLKDDDENNLISDIEYKSMKGKDTIYFYFDYSKNLEKNTYNLDSITKEIRDVYFYHESNPKMAIYKRKFLLSSGKYISSTERAIDKKADVKFISKSFLRKNKDIIIYPKDLEGKKMKKVIDEINAVVYVIDTSEKKGNKFIAREVKFSVGTFMEL